MSRNTRVLPFSDAARSGCFDVWNLHFLFSKPRTLNIGLGNGPYSSLCIKFIMPYFYCCNGWCEIACKSSFRLSFEFHIKCPCLSCLLDVIMLSVFWVLIPINCGSWEFCALGGTSTNWLWLHFSSFFYSERSECSSLSASGGCP